MSTPSDELVERVIEVTGANGEEAKHLLGACNNDVESAVALYFEQGGGGDADAITAATPTAVIDDDEDNVRAPIAPRREQLIGPEDDNFLAAPSLSNAGRMQRMNQRVKVCPFRDFAREGALMEEQMLEDASGTATTSFGAHNSRRWTNMRAATMVASAALAQQATEMKPTSSRLGDLFRPPTDISFAGNFQAARARATALSNWLLVNVQDDNFNSQVLNRDVWSNKELRQVIKRRFLLWQIDSDTSEGRRFSTFYHCANLPYVCVVDPRTGEEMWKCTEPKESNVLPGLRDFIREHKEFLDDSGDDDNSPSTSKRTITVSDDEPDVETSAEKKKRLKLLDLTEEEQINLAIRNSMRENGIANGKSKRKSNGENGVEDNADDSSDFESIEDFGDEDSKSALDNNKNVSYETQLGKATEELTAIRLRLLNADGNDEVVQLRWPSDTLLKVLRLYIGEKHAHVIKNGGSYKLICAFPRKTLEADHDSSTIKELGLHPSANLHITLDE